MFQVKLLGMALESFAGPGGLQAGRLGAKPPGLHAVQQAQSSGPA